MTFTRPKVGPRVYLSRGPSGHTETFERERADRAMQHFIGASRVKLLVEGFIRKMLLDRRVESWPDVIAYLGEMVHVDADLVPLNVAVAFWAHVNTEREAAKAARLVREEGN